MPISSSTSNYISRFITSSAVYHLYHDNIILFNGEDLFDVVFPGLFHELRIKSKYPQMFDNIASAPSRYKLPSYIDADKLIEEIITSVANSLIFIHTWIRENTLLKELTDKLLQSQYPTYEVFFEQLLSFIIGIESDNNIKDLACDFRTSIRKISQYLGPYHGHKGMNVYKTHDIVMAAVLLLYISRL